MQSRESVCKKPRVRSSDLVARGRLIIFLTSGTPKIYVSQSTEQQRVGTLGVEVINDSDESSLDSVTYSTEHPVSEKRNQLNGHCQVLRRAISCASSSFLLTAILYSRLLACVVGGWCRTPNTRSPPGQDRGAYRHVPQSNDKTSHWSHRHPSKRARACQSRKH
jgi:hypothetical protein